MWMTRDQNAAGSISIASESRTDVSRMIRRINTFSDSHPCHGYMVKISRLEWKAMSRTTFSIGVYGFYDVVVQMT